MPKAITEKQLKEYSESFNGSTERQMATLAFAKSEINDVSYDATSLKDVSFNFSINIPTLPATSQERTGRCWLFSATNVLRERIARTLNVDNFEISQSYLAFWDKFERANYFLENIMATADLPTDDRNVSFILSTGVHDGGQWEMFANIVRKYGIVPKSVFGETYQSAHSSGPNRYLNQALKREAAVLRNMIHNGATEEELQAEKNRMLDKVYSFLCSCYTEPPCTFDLEYTDKDKSYHIVKNLTPHKFYEEYVGDLLDKTVSVINAPTKDKEFHKTYTIHYLTNVVGGHDVVHLNLTMEEMKAAIIAQLSAGKVVWFGSDVGHDGERKKGIWDDNAYNVALMTGLDLDINKEDGLDYGFSAMNHAMVITGVNLEDGKPTKWKIENSWGDDAGNKGYYICSDSWFDKYVYQAAIEKEYLGDLAALADQEPIMLEAWDPMGTLAD